MGKIEWCRKIELMCLNKTECDWWEQRLLVTYYALCRVTSRYSIDQLEQTKVTAKVTYMGIKLVWMLLSIGKLAAVLVIMGQSVVPLRKVESENHECDGAD